MKLAKIVIATFISFLPIRGHAETYYSIMFDEDAKNEVTLELPENWIEVEEEHGTTLHDWKFVHKNADRMCLYVVELTDDHPVTGQDLKEAGDELKEEYYKTRRTDSNQSHISEEIYWETFQVLEGENLLNAMIAVYPIQNYLIGMVIETPESENPADDLTDFMTRIGVGPRDSEPALTAEDPESKE